MATTYKVGDFVEIQCEESSSYYKKRGRVAKAGGPATMEVDRASQQASGLGPFWGCAFKLKKVESLGPAKDAGVHPEELILAKLIQNVASRGGYSIKGVRHDGNGGHCAIGACELEPDTHELAPKVGFSGNDAVDTFAPYTQTEEPKWRLSAAYEIAMRRETP